MTEAPLSTSARRAKNATELLAFVERETQRIKEQNARDAATLAFLDSVEDEG